MNSFNDSNEDSYASNEELTIREAILRNISNRILSNDNKTIFCRGCGEEIEQSRRIFIKGCLYCKNCQTEVDKHSFIPEYIDPLSEEIHKDDGEE